ncbi:MAG: UDP-3-O-acyl-N-acetylglucosamine deacetylase [Candidatus Gastranaerophilales bacterium]|nr:UDP-3-O-acyl-N-acetylglucosamine deacetylase [Candidatus Gastranaerophilales bacterium]
MNTLKKEVEITSVCLMTGKECTAKVLPSEEKGIRFHLDGKTVEAHVDNLVSTEHCVVIGNKDVKKIVLIEHFMAACAICNLDSLDVYLSFYEMPILDGSSKTWVALFKKAGLQIKENRKYILKEPVQYLNGKTHLVMLPSDKLSISYSVNYKHPDLTHRWVSYDSKKFDEIIEARTFGYLKELKLYQLAGYGRGVTIDNTVGMKDDGSYTTDLRSDYEPAKHKILDLIGDLRLTGFNPLNLKAEIIVKEAGHTVHSIIAKQLKDKITEEK